MENGFDPEINEQIRCLMNTDIAAAAAVIKQNLDRQENIRLNIAITGDSGSGKSSFVNTFRGININNEGAAPVGLLEIIRDPNPYRHPDHSNVILWDLPGIGTITYPRDEYFQKTGFGQFDFFIIMSHSHLRENDIYLANKIRRMGKRFYFIHSKIDRVLKDEENRRRDFNATRTLEQIKEHFIEGLRTQGFEDTQIFLMCNFQRQLYDFPLFNETFIRELPGLKRRTLRMPMFTIFLEVLANKKKAFASKIKYYAGLSAAGAAVPIPGLSAAIDLSLIVKVVKDYVAGFGLDPSSLQRLADNTELPFDQLTVNIRSLLVNREITPELIMTMLTQCANIAGLLAAEEGTRWIPILGIPIGMVLSFTTTQKVLNFFLDEIANGSEIVFGAALWFLTL